MPRELLAPALLVAAAFTAPALVPQRSSLRWTASAASRVAGAIDAALGRLASRRRSRELQDEALRWAMALAAELRAGTEAATALASVDRVQPLAHRAARAATTGGDIPAGLRTDALRAGVPLLNTVAACWQVGQSSGAGLADAVENLSDGYRRTLAIERSIDAELAAPRATARLMAILPLIGVGLATMLGANPVAWLMTTPLGLLTLAAGLSLNLLGAGWTRHLARQMEPGK
ncbi:MAG: type II secretion system F family protein [Candidatus Nanopelagicales bacterium]|nr:type II secretion system F family protein [Candidatus Nanopelagicales bacterium]MDZ4248711.1 type II secretion system F family protein [Candidatus Nanopelagicales bacterium]